MKRISFKIVLATFLAIGIAFAAGCSAIDEMVQVVLPAPTPSGFSAVLPANSAQATEISANPTAPNPLKTTVGENEWNASCDAFQVHIKQSYIGQSRAYIADVVVKDMRSLKSAYAFDAFESRRKEQPNEMAKRHNAVFAVNGDYYSYRSDGIIFRNGVLDRNRPARDMLAIFEDGHLEIIDEHKADMGVLIDKGLLHTLSFGPALVVEGKAIEDFSSSNIKNSNPRTGIGQIAPGHLVFVVVDGRQEDTHGMTLKEFAQVFEDLGCTLAYNFDGGASSTMIFMGEHINHPSGNLAIEAGKERTISDILFLAEP